MEYVFYMFLVYLGIWFLLGALDALLDHWSRK